jgi:hypothetical protein
VPQAKEVDVVCGRHEGFHESWRQHSKADSLGISRQRAQAGEASPGPQTWFSSETASWPFGCSPIRGPGLQLYGDFRGFHRQSTVQKCFFLPTHRVRKTPKVWQMGASGHLTRARHKEKLSHAKAR